VNNTRTSIALQIPEKIHMSDNINPNDAQANLNQLTIKAAALIQQLQTQISQLTERAPEINAIKDALENSKAVALADAQYITDAKTRLGELEAPILESIAGLNTTRDSLTQQISDVQSTVTEFVAKRDALRNLLTEISEIKNGADNATTAIQRSVADASAAKETIEALSTSAHETSSKLSNQHNSVTTQISELASATTSLLDQKQTLTSIVDELYAIKTNAEANKNSVANDVQVISEARQQFDALSTQTQESYNNLSARYQETESKINEINNSYDAITKAHAELLTDRDIDNAEVKSLSTQIREMHGQVQELLGTTRKQGADTNIAQRQQISEFDSTWSGMKDDFKAETAKLIQTAQIQVETLKTNLESEIRSLLPGAGAAGLASAYVDAKSNYGPIPFEYTGTRQGRWVWLKSFGAWCAHQVRNYSAPIVFYAMFIGPVAVFAWFFHDILDFFKTHPEKFDPSLFLFRVGISIPLLTVSLFGWNSIRMHRQLFEEYNHKQRVMQLYDSFKREIQNAGTEDQQKMLLGIMLATVADKPSLAMHKYEKGVESLIPSINLGNIGGILGIASATPKEKE
jgi:predicted  nucleic acid-binding Zn-ribbon protein